MNANVEPSDDDFFVFEATNIDGLWKYLKTIDWREQWLQALLTFHVVSFFLILFTRKKFYVQMGIFFSLLGICFFAEKINEHGAKNWKRFAKEQYFDSNGLFISVVLSAPIILNTLFIVILWLIETFHLLKATAVLKGQRLKKQKEKQKEKESNEAKKDK